MAGCLPNFGYKVYAHGGNVVVDVDEPEAWDGDKWIDDDNDLDDDYIKPNEWGRAFIPEDN